MALQHRAVMNHNVLKAFAGSSCGTVHREVLPYRDVKNLRIRTIVDARTRDYSIPTAEEKKYWRPTLRFSHSVFYIASWIRTFLFMHTTCHTSECRIGIWLFGCWTAMTDTGAKKFVCEGWTCFWIITKLNTMWQHRGTWDLYYLCLLHTTLPLKWCTIKIVLTLCYRNPHTFVELSVAQNLFWMEASTDV